MKNKHTAVKFLILSLSLLLTAAFLPGHADAQVLSAAEKKKFRVKEDSLKEFARYMVTDSLPEDRMVADSILTRTLVRTLQMKHSFLYPFDSVHGISKIYSPDSLFRIFTWNIQFDDYYSRQRGAIQMKTRDGSLKLFPLRDVSEFTTNAQDSVRNRSNWIGAVYYNMILKEHNGKKYYTLFGIDYNSIQSNKKWIEVLTFDERNEPRFGGQFFSYAKDSVKKKTESRFTIEFKKNARVLVNYIPDLDLILVDHLVSETDEPEHPWTFVPDGDNEAFRWENGQWLHVDKAFDFKLDTQGMDMYLGKPPVGEPILDNRGKRDEKKLKEKSDRNREREE